MTRWTVAKVGSGDVCFYSPDCQNNHFASRVDAIDLAVSLILATHARMREIEVKLDSAEGKQ